MRVWECVQGVGVDWPEGQTLVAGNVRGDGDWRWTDCANKGAPMTERRASVSERVPCVAAAEFWMAIGSFTL